MKVEEANQLLKKTMKEIIVKMNAPKNEGKIMSILEAYISECSENRAYDQVANVKNLIAWANKGDLKGFLGARQEKDTLTHINKI